MIPHSNSTLARTSHLAPAAFDSEIRNPSTRSSFAKLRDGLQLTSSQLRALIRKRLAIYDVAAARYVCEPTALARFNAGMCRLRSRRAV